MTFGEGKPFYRDEVGLRGCQALRGSAKPAGLGLDAVNLVAKKHTDSMLATGNAHPAIRNSVVGNRNISTTGLQVRGSRHAIL